MVSLFCRLHHVTQNFINLNNTDRKFLDFANKHIFYDNNDEEHLPISVYSGIKPSRRPEFIFNTLLFLGIFYTEREILLNDTIRGCFRNVKFIGEEDDPIYMQSYLKQVMNYFVKNKLVFFPNGQRTIVAFIIQTVDLLGSIIINNEITIHEMPEVQILVILHEHEKVFEQF